MIIDRKNRGFHYNCIIYRILTSEEKNRCEQSAHQDMKKCVFDLRN